MALWHVPGRGVLNDEEQPIPEYGSIQLPNGQLLEWGDKNVVKVPEYRNPAQYGESYSFQWVPGAMGGRALTPDLAAPGYLPRLFEFQDRIRQGTAYPYEREEYEQLVRQAQAIPTRDIATLRAGEARQDEDPWGYLNVASPDLGPIMLALRDKVAQGQASDQERVLYETTWNTIQEQNYRANVPQPSDSGFGLGDNLFGALAIAGLGLSGGLAAAPLLAGGAGLATTLGSLGTLAGVAGTGAGVLGQALDQPWLRNIGLGLGIAGGLAGGIGGLTNVLGGGVTSVSDAARLAQSAGKVTGALGRIPGADPLRAASRYLGLAGGLGQGASGVQGLLGAAEGVTQGATQGGPMAWDDWSNTDWLNWSGGGQGPLLSDAGPGLDWGSFTAGGPGSWAGQELTDWASGGGGSGGGGILSTLGGLAGGLGKVLGSNASWLGPAASALGSLGGGALGSRASSDAAALQSQALNRGLDLQTAQWLQQQANQAPWMQAGREALGHAMFRAGLTAPNPAQTPAISGANYAMPGATPGWTPQTYAGYTPTDVPSAAGYAYTPGQGPRAQDYRYTPGAIPGAADYRYTPGAVPTLSGQELLANDPGVAFRLQEGRNALEASAAARGGALSGPALAALQRQGQDLSSQEYGNAWQRAAQQAQMREGWAQTASQMGFGQAMSEAQLREQVNQIASQQGWSQAQAEAAFREQLAQQSSAQNWGQAAQEAQMRAQQQQFGWQAGFQGQQQGQRERQQYDSDLYNRLLQQSQIGYGRDVYQNQTDYDRAQQTYRNDLAELTRQFNMYSGLSGGGQVAAGQLGQLGQSNATQMASLLSQLGNAQAGGTLGSGQSWMSALGNVGNAVQGGLANQQLLSALQGLNR